MAISTVDLQAAAGAAAPTPKPAKRQKFRFITNTKTLIGLIILGCYVLLAIFGPMLTPYDPDARGDVLLSPPTGAHWFGTTHLGQDIFSQVLAGARGVVYVGLLAGLVATVLAVIIGVSSGYLANAGGEALSALSNVFLV